MSLRYRKDKNKKSETRFPKAHLQCYLAEQ